MLADYVSTAEVQESFWLTLRILVAAACGGILGWQREAIGKAAGMRTHMLVAITSALVISLAHHEGYSSSDTSRVIQGLLTGIGFLGAGSILKLNSEQEVHGLTTAANLWVTSAIGMAAGYGKFLMAAIACLLTWLILDVLARVSPNTVPSSRETTPQQSSP